jgi:hypothetical protein
MKTAFYNRNGSAYVKEINNVQRVLSFDDDDTYSGKSIDVQG